MRSLAPETASTSKCCSRPLYASTRRLARQTYHKLGEVGRCTRLRVAQLPVESKVLASTSKEQQISASDGIAAASMLQDIVAPVAVDMEQMNRNLRNVVGSRHPMLVAAADQIFGAGGKKLRPMVVFLVARATAELAGMR